MGEHKIPRDMVAKARDLRNLREGGDPPAAAEDAWNPVRPDAFSCAVCFWNWVDDVPGVTPPQRRPSCHLMPRQMSLTAQNQIAAMLPGFSDPRVELCSGFKERTLEPAPAAGIVGA